MKHLNLSHTPDIDLHQLDSKNRLLIEDYATELRAVVRYLFQGQVVPKDIQEHCKALFPKLESITTWTRIKMPESDLQYGIKAVAPKEWSINIFQAGFGVTSLRMRLTRDLARGNHPLREVIHKNTLYREVPYNGNVYSHLHHQHPRYDTTYLSSLELSGLISPTQRELLRVFHRVHDLPEMSNGDHFAPDKHEGHIEDDTHAIGLILDYASIDYTPTERAFMQSLFARFEGNDTVFKPGEIINYFRDAINVFNNAQYYAHDIYFALSIFNNYFKRFLDRSHTITLIGDTPALQKSSTLPLQDIPLARVFFRDNASKIDSMIEMGIVQRADIEHPTHFPFQDPQELHTLLQTREQLKVVYNIA